MQENNPLSEIYDNDLCTGCGACETICPKDIIDFNFVEEEGLNSSNMLPNNVEECIASCSLCYKACPAVDRKKSNGEQNIEASHNLQELLDWLIGPYKEIYTGYAVDKNVRYKCSSGGIATVLMSYLLRTNRIDGVLVAEPVPGDAMKHRICLVKNAEDLENHSGTVYCQIDFSYAWQYIQETQDRLAIMGQACYLEAVDLFMAAKKLDTSRIFKIGLFCGGTSDHGALAYLCNRKKIKPNEILNISYRGNGWPGRTMIASIREDDDFKKTKNVVLLEKNKSLFQTYLYKYCFSGAFFPQYCLICKDLTAESADISLGDAWLPKFTLSDKSGTNILISRTMYGQEIIRSALSDRIIELEEAKPEDVLHSQGNALVGRKIGLWGKHLKYGHLNIPALKLCKRFIPQYIPDKLLLMERRFFRWLVTYMPVRFSFVVYIFYNLMVSFGQVIKRMTIKVLKKSETQNNRSLKYKFK